MRRNEGMIDEEEWRYDRWRGLCYRYERWRGLCYRMRREEDCDRWWGLYAHGHDSWRQNIHMDTTHVHMYIYCHDWDQMTDTQCQRAALESCHSWISFSRSLLPCFSEKRPMRLRMRLYDIPNARGCTRVMSYLFIYLFISYLWMHHKELQLLESSRCIISPVHVYTLSRTGWMRHKALSRITKASNESCPYVYIFTTWRHVMYLRLKAPALCGVSKPNVCILCVVYQET